MNKTLFSLAVVAISLQAEGLSQKDRDFAMSYLHATRKQVLDAVDGLTEAQWKFKQADDRWSVAQVLEHIVVTERALLGMVQKTASGPASPVPEASKVKDEDIMKMISSREKKVQAPEQLRPTGSLGTGASEIEQFKQARDATINYVRTTSDDLRAHSGKSPLGQVDCVQWLLYIGAHSERHLAQILEVKADPKFPK
jgi:hypothetical protein